MRFERLRTVTDPRYAQAMELYRVSFPLHEQRLPDSQAAILGHPDYRFHLIYDGTELAGVLLCWESAHFLYVEHFCIFPDLRGRTYGRRALNLLAQAGKPIILEIDPPVDPIALRRQTFYQQAGYQTNPYEHIHPPYRKPFSGHRLVVLSFPGPLSQADYDEFNAYLRNTVMAL